MAASTDQKALSRFMLAFESLLHNIGASSNGTAWMHVDGAITHRGVVITPGSVSLKPSFAAKVMQHVELAHSHKVPIQNLCGEIQYVHEVLRPFPVRNLFHLFAQWGGKDCKRRLAVAALAEVRRYATFMFDQLPWSSFAVPHPSTILFTDASATALASAFASTDTQWEFAWSRRVAPELPSASLNINVLELQAVVHALNDLNSRGFPSPLLFVDNSSALRAIAKGFSSSSRMFAQLRTLQRPCDWAAWIPSAANPADYPSRMCRPPLFLPHETLLFLGFGGGEEKGVPNQLKPHGFLLANG
jgi:hypothetical protein